MNKMWRVMAYEYSRHVLRKRFLFALLSVPLWLLVMIAAAFLAVFLMTNRTPLGYVDYSGVLANPVPIDLEEGSPFTNIPILPFAAEDEARAALEAGRIQAYYVLPEDYLQTRRARLVYKEEPSSRIEDKFSAFVRRGLLARQPETVAERILDGPEFVIRAEQEGREVRSKEWMKIFAPAAAGVILATVVFSTGGYLMQAVVEEKENRTMEILVTSLSPMQIMAGKIIGLMAVGLTQVFTWSLVPAVGVALAAAYLPAFRASIDWGLVGLIFLLVMPTFVMISALMAAIGATVIEASEGQQITGLVSLPVMLPYMLIGALITNPGSPMAVALSLFPLTSALTILIRMAVATVPTWQIVTGAALLIVSAVGSLWLAGRIFRLGMLRYGQRIRWRELLASFRSAR